MRMEFPFFQTAYTCVPRVNGLSKKMSESDLIVKNEKMLKTEKLPKVSIFKCKKKKKKNAEYTHMSVLSLFYKVFDCSLLLVLLFFSTNIGRIEKKRGRSFSTQEFYLLVIVSTDSIRHS